MPAKMVLIVEDDPDNRAIYQTILEHAGYRVVLAVNGQEGVERATAQPPDLILMDLSMPVMDGWEAIRQLRSDPRTASVPACVLSAHVIVDGGYHAAIRAGFQGYLTKPVEPKHVLKEVRDWIGDP